MVKKPKYPGIRITTNGNTLVSYYTEARITDAGIFYPITPSTEMGENYQLSYAEGRLNVFGKSTLAIEAEGEHAAQGGATAYAVTGKRVVNFTSGQGIAYAMEQYYHAPGKLCTMVLEVAARALTKHALNVHCGHDDVYATLDTGWTTLFGKNAQQVIDQAIILRKVNELSLTPGINCQDGFLTSHIERTFYYHEAELLREFLGSPEDIIECPTENQKKLFGETRRRVPELIDLKNPILLGPVQNQEHYMQGVIARRNNFVEPILGFLETTYKEFGDLTGRYYGLISEYMTDDADTVFISMGSAAENIEAAVDYLRTKGESVGSIHLNVLRPFPEKAIVEALKGKKAVIILERTDEAMATDNPITRETRAAFTKALENTRQNKHAHLPAITMDEMPLFYSGSYGLGSRDFRPEGILGAYEFVTGKIKRTDGKGIKDGVSYFTVGIHHPYSVISKETPSLLPDHSIAIRFHSIGGWGMITTGKNLGEIIGEFGQYIAKRDKLIDASGQPEEVIHVSANPKYGSEKKGAPTAYFLVVSPENIRVNCDLHHVDVVLCCDPKAFTHANPLTGLVKGGAFVWESDESPKEAWQRIPKIYRRYIKENDIRVFLLPGFKIAEKATPSPELQLRMQGNTFLGAFFAVSSFLKDNNIDNEHFFEVAENQYEKKFGRFGQAVVDSNMEVMKNGFEMLTEIEYGDIEAPDTSLMRGDLVLPCHNESFCSAHTNLAPPVHQEERAPLFQVEYFNKEFKGGYGYNQPATALSSVGMMAPATGRGSSKYVSRREKPIFIAENCTQCMKCIAACPDTAMPNTAQEISTILRTAITNYVSDKDQRKLLLDTVPEMDTNLRQKMLDAVKEKSTKPFKELFFEEVEIIENVSQQSIDELESIIDILPVAYTKASPIFSSVEKKKPGEGGLFSIFISDLCKGCAECVVECGEHEALVMRPEDDKLNAEHLSSIEFLNLLHDTPQKYLGLYDKDNPMDSKAAALRNHLMLRSNYEALVAGDGACAGCGEKTVLHSIVTVTEAYLRPIYHAKAQRLHEKVEALKKDGIKIIKEFAAKDKKSYENFLKSVKHLIMGLGGENEDDTKQRIKKAGNISDKDIVDAIVAVLTQDAFNHRELQSVDGFLHNGMSVMAMGANTGCNTVYGSTPPNNPHPYPWMNSLFQDGATVAWLFGESFITDHARRSVIPERLADKLLNIGDGFTDEEYFRFKHFTEAQMTDQEIKELPKAWATGGDGGMGDIGFQNVSKAVLQNRPNVNILLLDTQVYSNTGGQNSDSSVMTGGFDMNQFGLASQGKLTERKSVAESFTAGHGSPYVATISIANAPKFYKAILDGLEYRGTCFLQCYTTCQPEHGVADDSSTVQAQKVRDSRGMPEFIFDSGKGESYEESLDIKGNPSISKDWWEAKYKSNGEKYKYTVAHWCATEGRFKKHLRRISEGDAKVLIPLEDMLVRIMQDDVVHKRYLDKNHRSFTPDFGTYIKAENAKGVEQFFALSRHMVLFCVERRKSWRLLQSRAGIVNNDYKAQRSVIKKVDAGEISLSDFLQESARFFEEELLNVKQ